MIAMMQMDFFIARHPLLDAKQEVFAYELLHRSGNDEQAAIVDGELASTEVILNCFLHIGIDVLVGTATAFVNVTERFLKSDYATPMFDTQIVFEIPRHVTLTPELVDLIAHSHAQGFQFCLKSMVHTEQQPAVLPHVDYVKIDALAGDLSQVPAQLETLRNHGIKAIAERVETQETFAYCKTLGFDYFQGFFFAKPQVLQQHTLTPNKVVVLNLFNKLQAPDIEVEEIEAVLAHDISLSYKFLRYINSAAFALRCEITSLRQAITLIGLNKVKQWASLILATELAEDKPQELVVTGLVRARMCELVAAQRYPEVQAHMFIVGLFSVLDALMDAPMIDLLDNLGLSMPIKVALLDYDGVSGALLKRVVDYTEGRWEQLLTDTEETATFTSAYLDSLRWADQSIQALFGPAQAA